MSDSFNVSARVWPVMVDGAKVCKFIALNGFGVFWRDADQVLALTDKAAIADFVWQVMEAHTEKVDDVFKIVTEAVLFAFSEPPPVKREAKPNDELRDWLKVSLGHSSESMVYAKDLRTAWNEYFNATHNADAYWTPHQFHERLRELGYTVKRVKGQGGTGTHIIGVCMRKDRPCVSQGKARLVH